MIAYSEVEVKCKRMCQESQKCWDTRRNRTCDKQLFLSDPEINPIERNTIPPIAAMRKKFHGLKRPKIRQDWSKWNLYNLSRMILPPAANKTFFQQKWLAKSNTRAYHGEQIREGQWTRMFDRRLPAVVPMDHRVLASTDGSDQSAGRGSGLDQDPSKEQTKRRNAMAKTPYMHMTYHPTERRLDTAIWRALFASSTRQARQFVVHGFVKVNGKKVRLEVATPPSTMLMNVIR